MGPNHDELDSQYSEDVRLLLLVIQSFPADTDQVDKP